MKWYPTPPHHLMTQMVNQDFQAAGSEHQLPDLFSCPIFDLKVKQRKITKPSNLGHAQVGCADVGQGIIISKHCKFATN